MIKNWQIFNESVSNELTKEQAQEIIYYFSENSRPDKKISDEFYDTFGDHFIYYETGYEEMKQYVRDLLSKCKENQDLTNKMIEMYHKIRKEREIFPEAHEIEEMLSDFMDLEDFSFMIYSTESEYKIKLWKSEVKSLDLFIKYCQNINGSLDRLESPDYKTKLTKCEFSNDINNMGREYGYVRFEIILKKIWSKR